MGHEVKSWFTGGAACYALQMRLHYLLKTVQEKHCNINHVSVVWGEGGVEGEGEGKETSLHFYGMFVFFVLDNLC